MRILKQTYHPHPLVVQPCTLLMPLLLLILLSFAVGGVLKPHSV
jgi:hypothetical protein